MGTKEKLIELQSKIKVEKLHENKFGGFMYRNAEDIFNAAKPLCTELGLLLIVTDELMNLGERYYVKATAIIESIEPESEIISVSSYAREEVSRPKSAEPQLTGSASSYARKYALNGLLLLDDVKDADYAPEPEKVAKNMQTAPQQPTRQQIITKCIEFAQKLNFDADEMAQYLEQATDKEVIERYNLLKKQIG